MYIYTYTPEERTKERRDTGPRDRDKHTKHIGIEARLQLYYEFNSLVFSGVVLVALCVGVSRASSLKRRCRPYKGTLTSTEGGGVCVGHAPAH
jgi:hypothetical protein